ncbi:MAG: DegT/DnrJ/EryC1/StrS family aminotransferase [bacterium]
MGEKKFNIALPSFHGNEKKYVLDALDTGWISSIGKYIESFERSFAQYHGVKHAIATHNGTIALHLSLAAAGIREEDEVIVPDLTFIATANSVRYCNAIPVLTDVNADTWNIDPGYILKNLTPRTKAIIPVHLYGNPARMDEIMKIAREKSLLVVEDCAEATGASISGRKVGTFGNIGVFSFFGNKIITTGEGGMCITNDDTLAEKMRILRDHGMNLKKKYWYDHLGFNYRMTNLQAAVGLAQLEQLDELLLKRKKIYEWYRSVIGKNPGIIFQDTEGNDFVNWLITVRIKGFDYEQRDRVMEELKKENIDSRPVFYPIHLMPFYQSSEFIRQRYPNSITVSSEGISLPTFVDMTEEDILHISNIFLSVANR